MGIYFDPEKQAQSLERAKSYFRKREYLEGMYELASILGAASVTSHPDAWELGSSAYDWAARCFHYVDNLPETSLRDKALMENVFLGMKMRYPILKARHKK